MSTFLTRMLYVLIINCFAFFGSYASTDVEVLETSKQPLAFSSQLPHKTLDPWTRLEAPTLGLGKLNELKIKIEEAVAHF